MAAAADFDRQTPDLSEAQKDRQILDAASIHRAQAQLGRNINELASAGIATALAEGRTVSPLEAARLAEVGVKIERLVSGEATSRTEIVSQVLRPVVQSILAVFVESNEMASAPERLAAFAEGAQRVIDGALVAGEAAE